MIKSIERNHVTMSKSKKQMSDIKKKDLTDEDKIRLQLIDEAINRIKIIPADQSTNQKDQQIESEHTAISSRKYNINKYKEVDRTTAQVEPEQVVKNTYFSHPNLEVMKFIIDKIWATITTRKQGDDFIFSSDNFIKLWELITQENEDDIEKVLEEPLMRAHSCIGKTYKKKDLIRVMDVLIKNVSISVIDNVLWNSIEKLYRINKDFVRLSDAPTSEITENDF